MIRTIACTYEDRPECHVGVKLLALSLARHCPDVQLHIFTGGDDDRLRSWAQDRPNVAAVGQPYDDGPAGWDTKPRLLLDLLRHHDGDVWWLDSDLIVTADWRRRLGAVGGSAVVVAEENASVLGGGLTVRTERLGRVAVRTLPRPVCGCTIRVTRAHRDLLGDWGQAVQLPEYRRQQTLSWTDRDPFLEGDQDLLEGLLGSEAHGAVPVHMLRSGRDVAHCFCRRGYRLRDRLRNLPRGLPPLVHAQGPKPWQLPGVLFAELSPYCHAAAPYVGQLGEPAPWARPRRPMAKLLNALALGNPNLRDAALFFAGGS